MTRHLFRRALPQPLLAKLRALQQRRREIDAERAVAAFKRPAGSPHDLPGKLIVSLTSYPPRYPTLDKTLKSLLMQTVRPDHLVLWVAEEDRAALPDQVRALAACGLEIRTCEDLRSYNKIIPSLKAFPDAYVVTADDDLYYGPRHLETLVHGVIPGRSHVVCRRAHRPRWMGQSFAPYKDWEKDVVTGGRIDWMIFPTTGHGALYPPGSLAPEVTDQQTFLTLCPHADDVWLFVMALRAAAGFRQVGPGVAQIAWSGSQDVTLMQENLAGDGNDRQLAAVVAHFGAEALYVLRASA